MFFQFIAIKNSLIHLWCIFWIHDIHHVWNWWCLKTEKTWFLLVYRVAKNKNIFEFNWIVIGNLWQPVPTVSSHRVLSAKDFATLFTKKYSNSKQQFLEDSIFLIELLFLYHPGNLVWHTMLIVFPWISWICGGSTWTSQMHCCMNYKNWVKVEIHLDMFLSEHISQQFYFCDIVCFHPFEWFARHLQVFHVQQFWLIWLVHLFFILKYFQLL